MDERETRDPGIREIENERQIDREVKRHWGRGGEFVYYMYYYPTATLIITDLAFHRSNL